MWPFKKEERSSTESEPLTIKNLESYLSGNGEATSNLWAVTSFISKQCASYKFEVPKELNEIINVGNEQRNATALWSAIYLALLNTGNAYLKLDWDNKGRLVSIAPVNASPTIVTDELSQPYIKAYNVGGKIIPTYAIAHFRVNSLNGLIGRSPLTVCREAIQGLNAVEHYGTEVFTYAKRPSGFFKFTGSFQSGDSMKRFQEGIAAKKNGEVLVLENDIDYKPISLSAVDADYVNQAKFSVEQACRLFSLDPIFVSHSGTNSQSYASQREASKGLYNNTLKAYLDAVTSELRLKVLTEPQRKSAIDISVNQNEFNSMALSDRVAAYKSLVDMGAITAEQVAKREGF